MDNPLYNGCGKGSNPRSCHTPKFRKNYDGIDWGKKAITTKGSKLIGEVAKGSKIAFIDGRIYITHSDHKVKFIHKDKIKDVKL